MAKGSVTSVRCLIDESGAHVGICDEVIEIQKHDAELIGELTFSVQEKQDGRQVIYEPVHPQNVFVHLLQLESL
jgi:hypothetical protein